jgi:hypothetical protein
MMMILNTNKDDDDFGLAAVFIFVVTYSRAMSNFTEKTTFFVI